MPRQRLLKSVRECDNIEDGDEKQSGGSLYSLIYNTMAKIAMKDRKTVRIAEKPPPPPPPPPP